MHRDRVRPVGRERNGSASAQGKVLSRVRPALAHPRRLEGTRPPRARRKRGRVLERVQLGLGVGTQVRI